MKKPYTCGIVWTAMASAPDSTKAQLAAISGLDVKQVGKAINRLKDLGLADFKRKGSAAHWTASGECPQDGRAPDFVKNCEHAKAEQPAPPAAPPIDGCTLAQVWR